MRGGGKAPTPSKTLRPIHLVQSCPIMCPISDTCGMTKTTAGQALTERILADMESVDLDPDSREVELLTRAAVAADRIEELEAVVRREGSTFTDKNRSGGAVADPSGDQGAGSYPDAGVARHQDGREDRGR